MKLPWHLSHPISPNPRFRAPNQNCQQYESMAPQTKNRLPVYRHPNKVLSVCRLPQLWHEGSETHRLAHTKTREPQVYIVPPVLDLITVFHRSSIISAKSLNILSMAFSHEGLFHKNETPLPATAPCPKLQASSCPESRPWVLTRSIKSPTCSCH